MSDDAYGRGFKPGERICYWSDGSVLCGAVMKAEDRHGTAIYHVWMTQIDGQPFDNRRFRDFTIGSYNHIWREGEEPDQVTRIVMEQWRPRRKGEIW